MVRLLFKGITEIVGAKQLALIVLTTEDESRCVSVVCDKITEQQIALRLGKNPRMRNAMPEVLCDIIGRQTTLQLEVHIDGVANGGYCASVVNADTLQATPIQASEGVLLSLIAKLPIYMDDKLMLKQSVPYHEGATGLSLPINVISNEMLEIAMNKAISDENYELASQLRDEENRRKRHSATRLPDEEENEL